jgi:hypothetical protein
VLLVHVEDLFARSHPLGVQMLPNGLGSLLPFPGGFGRTQEGRTVGKLLLRRRLVFTVRLIA